MSPDRRPLERDGKPASGIDAWTEVRVKSLPKDRRPRFRRRKRALELYVRDRLPLNEISQRVGLSRGEIYRLVQRAFTVLDDGTVVGWLACIPGYRIKAYERRAAASTGKAGRVSLFFRENPNLLELVTAWALGKKSPDVGKVRGRGLARIWTGFLNALRDAKIDEATAPNRKALARVVRAIRTSNYDKSVGLLHGPEAARIARLDATEDSIQATAVPYESVQFDAHRLDVIITIRVTDADGTKRSVPLARLWLLLLIDVASRAVLGYSICPSLQVGADDVLDAFANALVRWVPKDTPSPRIAYRVGAGLPSGVLPGCERRAFVSLRFDNAMAHLSAWTQERIIETIGCEINTGRPASPLSRAVVERFFLTFEEVSLHKWPSTTGSGPSDPRRHEPDRAAERLEVELPDLELAVDLAIANYNTTPHSSLNGRTPLEYIRYCDERRIGLPRHIKHPCGQELPLFKREFTKRIAGDLRKGRRPYVEFMGVRYTNEALMHLTNLIGSPVTLVVNVKDLRYAEVFLANGASIGIVKASAPWLRHAHSLRTRRTIRALMRRGVIPLDSHDPVMAHLKFLEARARSRRADRNKLEKQRREIASDSGSDTGSTQPPPPDPMPRTQGVRPWVSVTKIYRR